MKMIFAATGERIGTLGDAALEAAIGEETTGVLENNRASLFRENEAAAVFLEPLQPRPTLLIAGAGHVGQALCHLGSWLDFDIAIVDDRADFCIRRTFAGSRQNYYRRYRDRTPKLSDYPVDLCRDCYAWASARRICITQCR